jgi:hypothetical protein
MTGQCGLLKAADLRKPGPGTPQRQWDYHHHSLLNLAGIFPLLFPFLFSPSIPSHCRTVQAKTKLRVECLNRLLSVVPLDKMSGKKISVVPLTWTQENTNLSAESIIFFNIKR